MASHRSLDSGGLLLTLILLLPSSTPTSLHFHEAPAFRNDQSFPPSSSSAATIHVAMTLDATYLRGTIAAVFSILHHSTCPENISLHFLSLRRHPRILSTISATFPHLDFKVYPFGAAPVRRLISKSVRHALDQPLNYARIYLSAILPVKVKRLIYLDSDVVSVDDVANLWNSNMNSKSVAAPEYCHANFTAYFTDEFCSDPSLSAAFSGRNPCYFNTGVMVMDLEKRRNLNYTRKVENWMAVQKQRRIYQLGSLPPFLLVLAGDISPVDHRWNQHGLGADSLEGKCRDLHPGPISLLNWSGKGKPWSRLDSKRACDVDLLWAPYDLHRSSRHALED